MIAVAKNGHMPTFSRFFEWWARHIVAGVAWLGRREAAGMTMPIFNATAVFLSNRQIADGAGFCIAKNWHVPATISSGYRWQTNFLVAVRWAKWDIGTST